MTRTESEVFRRKSAMVIYAIEVACVELLLSHGIHIDPEKITFGEIFQELGKLGNIDSELRVLKDLKALGDSLELASIRNSCAHPVREFHIHQWYRVACFAADPRLQFLKFVDVMEALACAEAGQISDPPQEWLDRIRIPTLPNNMPDRETFDATGLIGRSKEVETLLNDLAAGRVNTISLIGPGGVGKTSIAIEVARRVAAAVGNSQRFDGVVYLSFKSRELTAKGIVQLADSELSYDLYNQCCDALQAVYQVGGLAASELFELAARDDLLLILDNFEDLLLEKSAACYAFLESLPANWKVLVTSRVSVDGSKNVAVKGLSNAAIEGLARKYYEAVLGTAIPSDVLSSVCIACNGNPLALKLMIDRVSLGQALDEAKAITQSDILGYSFSSLIQSLNDQNKSVLEAIFVLGSAGRVSLLEITGLSSDELSETVNLLSRT